MGKNNIVIRGIRELKGATIFQRLNCSIVNCSPKRIVVIGSVDIISKVFYACHYIRTQGETRNLLFFGTHNLGQVDPNLDEHSKGS